MDTTQTGPLTAEEMALNDMLNEALDEFHMDNDDLETAVPQDQMMMEEKMDKDDDFKPVDEAKNV